MYWWIWLLIAVIVWISLVVARRHRNRRVQITINIPAKGFPNFQITPHDASPEDLSLLTLCYGSKIGWLLQTEPEQIRDIFHELCIEVINFWSAPGDDLIDQMPSARRLREDDSSPHAIIGGERFVVTLYRADYHNLQNKAWVITSIPRPGLAANLPWSFLLVLNAVFVLLKPLDRKILGQAMVDWCECALQQKRFERSLSSLNLLFKTSLECLLRAKTQEIPE